MIESYNLLLLMQFDGFYRNDNASKVEYDENLVKLLEKMKVVS